MQNNPTRVTHGRCQAEGTMQMPSPCMQHLGRSSLALNSSSPLQAVNVPLFCPDTAAEVRGPLVGAVLSLHPFPADELRHL